MASETLNVLLTTLSGLGLPPTLCVPLSADLPISSFTNILTSRLSTSVSDLRLTTFTSNINPSSNAPLSSLLSARHASFLNLHLTARLPGGKGGFGSQLRAAGGRMSSRKKRNQQGDVNGSNRNLDGRRLRTITEAKNLAEYLALKPEMDKREREERRKRWEEIVESADRREEEIKKGKGNVRLDGEWVEAKEEAEGKTRDAVLAAMRAGLIGKENERVASESSASAEDAEDDDSDEAEATASGSSEGDKVTKESGSRTFFGWDEDEDMSDEDEEDSADEPTPAYEGKGKGKAA